MSLNTVKLDTGLDCLADPCFIIEMNGGYYLAVAVLEYNDVQAGPNLMKTEGVARLRNLFERGYKALPVRACPINSNGTLPYLAPAQQHAVRSAAATIETSVAAPATAGAAGGWWNLAGLLDIFRKPRIPPMPPPPPINPLPAPPPPSGNDPLGMQTEPPGMQTSP